MGEEGIRWWYSTLLHGQHSRLPKGLGSEGEGGKAEIWGWKGETRSAAAGEWGPTAAHCYLHPWGDAGSHQATPTPPVRKAGNPCTELHPLEGFSVVIPFYFSLGRQFITPRQHRLVHTKAAALLRCHPPQSTRPAWSIFCPEDLQGISLCLLLTLRCHPSHLRSPRAAAPASGTGRLAGASAGSDPPARDSAAIQRQFFLGKAFKLDQWWG